MIIHKTHNHYLIAKLQEDALTRLDVDSLGVRALQFQNLRCRARYHSNTKSVVMNPHAKCFQANYRGYKYKTFGGVADLTPGGVFLHECGHALAFKHHDIIKAFRALWRHGNKKSITSYGSSSIGEDIAESFRLFMSNGMLLAQIRPDRFNILDDYAFQYKLRKGRRK